jgi:hypothetical protein
LGNQPIQKMVPPVRCICKALGAHLGAAGDTHVERILGNVNTQYSVDHGARAAETQALANIPPERARIHICWGNYALKRHHDLVFDPAVAAYNGRIVKLIGGGTIVEFGSVVDAVNCAVSVQRSNRALRDEASGQSKIILLPVR